MKFISNYFIWIWPPNFISTSYELHEKLPDNSCIFPTKFVRSSYEVLVKFIWIESFCYICISSKVHVNFIWTSCVIMCEISKWPWFSYVFHSKFIWHTDQNFQMKFHTNDTNRPSYKPLQCYRILLKSTHNFVYFQHPRQHEYLSDILLHEKL